MKFKKINDTSVRFLIEMDELKEKKITLDQFRYGSRFMTGFTAMLLDIAYRKLNFDISENPIMTEAVPLPGGDILFTISAADSLEELDNRFARFSKYIPLEERAIKPSGKNHFSPSGFIFVRFKTLKDAISASRIIAPFFSGKSSLYSIPDSHEYMMSLETRDISDDVRSKLLFHLAEYGSIFKYAGGSNKHPVAVIKNKAVSSLSSL